MGELSARARSGTQSSRALSNAEGRVATAVLEERSHQLTAKHPGGFRGSQM